MKTKLYSFLSVAFIAAMHAAQGFGQANTALSNLITPTAVNQSLLPKTDNLSDLGATSKGWRSFYFDGQLYFKNILALHATGTGNFFTGVNAGNKTLTGTYNSGFGQLALGKLTSGTSNAAIGYGALYTSTTGSYNSANGAYTLYNNTFGANNVADGFSALTLNTTGSSNIAIGARALNSNKTGNNSVAIGYQSSYKNVTGNSNVSIGIRALNNNTGGSNLIAIGDSALFNNTTGLSNTAIGSKSLYATTTGTGNTATGYQALYANTTGGYNNAFGYNALRSNTTGFGNSATGFDALYNNTSGYYNVANGYTALYSNTNGSYNSGVGYYALFSNTTGSYNQANGAYSLYYNTTASYNTANGYAALYQNTTGGNNTASGYYALLSNSTGTNNAALGSQASQSNTTGSNNTAVGSLSLLTNSTGGSNTATGYAALKLNTSGTSNTAGGVNSLQANTTGGANTGGGYASLISNTTGYYNTGFGQYSLYYNTTQLYNTGIGYSAGDFHSGANNTFVGAYASASADGFSNSSAIGYNTIINGSNQIVLGNTSITTIKAGTGYVIYSDGRFKKNIKQDVPGLEFIKLLKPVTYNYDVHGLDAKLRTGMNRRTDNNAPSAAKESADAEEKSMSLKEKIVYTGFVAQDVEQAAKKMNYDFSGVYKPQNDKDVYGLSYSDFVVPLVKAVQELSDKNDAKDATIDSLKAELAEIRAFLKMPASTGASLSDASLEQNAPNPFTNTTTIAYNLPRGFTKAQVLVTDAAGKVLKTINVNGTGKGTLSLDANTLSAGAYHYSLYVDNKLIGTKQMFLAR